jgi:2-oxoglutarate ferredoxin oxidoreductase subunit gamma
LRLFKEAARLRWEVRISGAGGQGIITAGHLIGLAATLHDRKDAIMTEDYSPYITGGWSNADIIISDEPIDYPLLKHPDVLIAMSQEAYNTHEPAVKDRGLIIVERSMVSPRQNGRTRLIAVPALEIAERLGRRIVANIVMIGAFAEATKFVSPDALKQVILSRFRKASKLNEDAFNQGAAAVPEARIHD